MNYLQKKKLAFMSIVNSVKGFVRTITGALPLTLEGCVDEESITDYKLYGQSVQDGTPTPDKPIDVESVGEYDESTGKYKIPIKVSGKNLFDVSKCENGTISFTTGANHNQTPRVRSDYIYLKAGTYCISTVGSSNGVYFGDYCHTYSQKDESTWHGTIKNGTAIYTGTRHYRTFVLDKDCYIRLILLPTSTSTVVLDSTNVSNYRPQLEEGTTATIYEPYHEPITTNIYLDEPLRKVGDYADYVDLENGKVVRNITYERIDTVTTKSSTGLVFLSPISKKPLLTTKTGNLVGYAMSDKFTRHTDVYSNLPNKASTNALIQTYRTSSGGAYRVAYTFGNSSITTLALAQEAIGDGFDVFYALATPTETSITLPNLPTFKGTSIISADTTVQPSNAEIEYYSNVKE